MGSTTLPIARWARSTLIGGLAAALTTLTLVTPAHAAIIPPDDRYPIGDTTVYPYSAVAEITLGYDDAGVNMGACTGWMYAANMVATAAHCVYDPARVSGGYFHISGMKVWPAINGSSAPYGSCTVLASHAATAYINGDSRYDYAALKVSCSKQPPTLNYGITPTVGAPTRVVGYPNDKPVDTQWGSDATVYTYDSAQVWYANDTVKRESGAPVMEWTGSAWNVIAIHSGPYSPSYNVGVRITSAVSNDLYNWEYYG